jgi:hypothetical protein
MANLYSLTGICKNNSINTFVLKNFKLMQLIILMIIEIIMIIIKHGANLFSVNLLRDIPYGQRLTLTHGMYARNMEQS